MRRNPWANRPCARHCGHRAPGLLSNPAGCLLGTHAHGPMAHGPWAHGPWAAGPVDGACMGQWPMIYGPLLDASRARPSAVVLSRTMGQRTQKDWISKEVVHVPPVDVLIFGFPCKDLSFLADKGRGGITLDDLKALIDLSQPFLCAGNESSLPNCRGALEYISLHLPFKVNIENLDKITFLIEGKKSLKDAIFEFFWARRYLAGFHSGCPRDIGTPSRRSRTHMDFTHFPQAFGMLGAEITLTPLHELYQRELTRCMDVFKKGLFKRNLNDYLVVKGSTLYEKLFNDAMTGHSNLQSDESDKQWPAYHESLYHNRLNRPRPDASELLQYAETLAEEECNFFNKLSVRCQEKVYLKALTMANDGNHCGMSCIDISQGKFETECDEATTCLTERGIPYLVGQNATRPLFGIEAFYLQGASIHEFPGLLEYGDAFCKDLAGNAFSAQFYIHFVVATLHAIGSVRNYLAREDEAKR